MAMVVDGSKIIDFVPLKDVDEMYQAEEVLEYGSSRCISGIYRRTYAYVG